MVFLPNFSIFMKLLFQSCVSVNDADKTRSVIQVIAVGEAYQCCTIWKLKPKVESKFLIINEKIKCQSKRLFCLKKIDVLLMIDNYT